MVIFAPLFYIFCALGCLVSCCFRYWLSLVSYLLYRVLYRGTTRLTLDIGIYLTFVRNTPAPIRVYISVSFVSITLPNRCSFAIGVATQLLFSYSLSIDSER